MRFCDLAIKILLRERILQFELLINNNHCSKAQQS